MKNLIQTITPKKAREWLKRNVSNRPLRESVVKRYATEMTEGRWKLNGESIKFNCNGDLIDGQHRLHAIDRANVTLDSYVLNGLPIDSFDTIDGGQPRNNGDRLARRGEKNYSTLASAARWVWIIESGTETMVAQSAFTLHKLDDTLGQHPTLRDSVQDARAMHGGKARGQSIVDPSILSAMLYLMRRSDTERANLFWTRVMGGEGLTKLMPEYKLRERLLANSRDMAKLPRGAFVALCVKAWNLAKAGKDCTVLRYESSREGFPTID